MITLHRVYLEHYIEGVSEYSLPLASLHREFHLPDTPLNPTHPTCGAVVPENLPKIPSIILSYRNDELGTWGGGDV